MLNHFVFIHLETLATVTFPNTPNNTKIRKKYAPFPHPLSALSPFSHADSRETYSIQTEQERREPRAAKLALGRSGVPR